MHAGGRPTVSDRIRAQGCTIAVSLNRIKSCCNSQKFTVYWLGRRCAFMSFVSEEAGGSGHQHCFAGASDAFTAFGLRVQIPPPPHPFRLKVEFTSTIFRTPASAPTLSLQSDICLHTMATAHVHVATAGTSRACAAFRVAPAGALHSAPFSSAASSPKRRSVLPAQRPARTAGLTCRAETEGEMREKVDEVEEILTKEPVKVEGTVKGALQPQLNPGYCAFPSAPGCSATSIGNPNALLSVRWALHIAERTDHVARMSLNMGTKRRHCSCCRSRGDTWPLRQYRHVDSAVGELATQSLSDRSLLHNIWPV